MALLQNALNEPLIATQAKTAVRIATDVKQMHDFLVARYNHLMNTFWRHPKLTPQQVADSLGTEASQLFILGGKLADLIIAITPEIAPELEVPLAPVQFNADGSVTILEPPVEEPPAEEPPVDDPQVIPNE